MQPGEAAVRAAMRAGPVAFARGTALIGPGGSGGIVFRLESGWVVLTRRAPRLPEIRVPVALALPGDLVGAEALAEAVSDAAHCLGPVSATAASEAALLDLAARDADAGRWLTRQTATWHDWAALRGSANPGTARDRLAALLSRLHDRLAWQGELPATGDFVLPMPSDRAAALLGLSRDSMAQAIEGLLDARVLRCALPMAESMVVGVADAPGLRALGRRLVQD
jgi:hypothetical protein